MEEHGSYEFRNKSLWCVRVRQGEGGEGAREHGKSHAQQDHITDSVYNKVDPEEPGTDEACPHNCPYKTKEIHYHCKWVSFYHLTFIYLKHTG